MTNKEAIEQLKWVGNRICQITCFPETFEALALAIKALEERPQGEWIPVSERLPDDRENTYWVCTDSEYQCQCRWTNVNPFWTTIKTDWHWCHPDIPLYQEVIAWQPLPEPYELQKGGAENEQ